MLALSMSFTNLGIVYESRKEASTELQRRAGILIVTGNDAVVSLEVELENIVLLSFDRVRVKRVVAGGCNLDRLSAGKVGKSS